MDLALAAEGLAAASQPGGPSPHLGRGGRLVNGHDVGRLASRLLAVLLALRALMTIPGIVSEMRGAVDPWWGSFPGDVLASTVLPLALAALCWWGAPGVARKLLAPGAAPGVWAAADLEATAFRAGAFT